MASSSHRPITSPSLLTLPETALAQIYRCSTNKTAAGETVPGHPLLSVSRGCRDIVLSSIHSITLYLPSRGVSVGPANEPETWDPAPWAGLLSRACCQATPGLTVKLSLPYMDDRLSPLLQPGITCGGWSKVHSLKVDGASCGTHLILQAFPALHSLSLDHAQLGDGSLFSLQATQPSPCLASLHLAHCSIDSAGVRQAAAALAQLPSLQALHLEGAECAVPTALAAQVTGLTRLSVCADLTTRVTVEQQLTIAAQNEGLGSLSIVSRHPRGQVLQPGLLQKVLTSCTGLTQLTLDTQTLDDQGLEVLLTHGTSITDLTLGETSLTTSKADRACSWQKLELHNGHLQEYAYLPLRGVQQHQVTFCGVPHSLGSYYIKRPNAQLPDLLRQATTNLASCPAWAKAPPSELLLHGDAPDLTSAQQVQLLQALAPVAGRHVTKLKLDALLQLGGAEAEALAGSFAGSLTSLHLDSVTLLDDFWRPLAQHFHNLQELCLLSYAKADAMSVATYLVKFSCCPSHWLNASIECFQEKDAVHLQTCVDAWGLENIQLDVKAAEEY